MAEPESALTWKDIEIGCIVTDAGSASQYRTGDWRSQKPILALEKCIKCGLCYIYCPEGCINQNAQGDFEVDMYYCKGCGICARECPKDVITMVEEEE